MQSYQQKWTIHGILQHLGFNPPTENPNVMMRENLKPKSSEYMIIYEDELYIASSTTEEILNIFQDRYGINIYLESNFPHDTGGRDISQIRKYHEKLYANVNILLQDELPKDSLHLKSSSC